MKPQEAILKLKSIYFKCSHLLEPKWRKMNEESGIESTGHCYVATEALFYLCGGIRSRLRPMYAKYFEGTHWWLVDEKGVIYDATDCQYGDEKPPYELGVRGGFLNGYKGPSKRAAAMIKLALSDTVFKH